MRARQLDIYHMDICEQASDNSPCRKRKVGASIVDGRVLKSIGSNRPVGGLSKVCEDALNDTIDIVVHAEVVAIFDAIKAGMSVVGSTLYTTNAPCVKCACIIKEAGIKEVVYKDKKTGTNNGIVLLKKLNIHVRQIGE